MKKTLRTMLLAAAGVVGNVAVALAQQPAPPAPPPGQPGQPAQPAPPPAEFGVAPAALPATPVGSAPLPTVTWGATQPSADTTTPTAPPPERKQNPFFFTRLTWGNSATTSMFGVGQNFQGTEAQHYDMDFTLNLRYYAINEPLDRLFINASLGVTTEITNSDTTVRKRQPYFRDLPIAVGYSHIVYRNTDRSLIITPSISASYSIPTSVQTRAVGRYGSLALNAGLTQIYPLAGPKSDWFSDIFVVGIVGWSHLFSKATTAVNDNIVAIRPRQGLDPTLPADQDQTGGTFFSHDNVRLAFTYYLTIYKDLSLGNTWEISLPFKYTGSGNNCVTITTGCVPIPASTEGTRNYVTTFDVGLSYTLFNTARIDLGYTHTTPALDGDNAGKRRSVFYGPDAAFYGNVSVYIDTILDKTLHLTDPQKKVASGNRLTRGAF